MKEEQKILSDFNKIKQVQINQSIDKNLYLFIFQKLKEGIRPSKICEEFGIKKNTIQYYLSSLKDNGFIKKVGYGVWEIIKDFDETSTNKSSRVANITPNKFILLKQDSVRGHAFQFTLQLPKDLRNWNKREEIFDKIGYKYKKLNIFGNGQSIEFKGRKVHLTDKSIIIYEKESFISETAAESQSHAIEHFIKLIKQIERDLQANFSFGGNYRFKVSRQHYSLIKNALARQYNDSGEKLEIYNDKGLWFLIDNSYNLNEAETLHPVTAVQDNKKVQDFFNGLKQIEGFTPQFVTNSLGSLSENINNSMLSMEEYNKNILLHMEVQKAQLKTQQDMQKEIGNLSKIIKEIKEIKDE